MQTQQKLCQQARYESGFRHGTAIDQAVSQHATPFDLALDTGTCKAGKARLSGVSHVRRQPRMLRPEAAYLSS